jgi:hypothetical protein
MILVALHSRVYSNPRAFGPILNNNDGGIEAVDSAIVRCKYEMEAAQGSARVR